MSYRDALNFFQLKELYTEDDLNRQYKKMLKEKPVIDIDTMYAILSNELHKRQLKEKINLLKENITKIKEKYANTKFIYLCNSFLSRIKNITNLSEIDDLKQEFDEKVALLKKQIIVPHEKAKIVENLKIKLAGASLKLQNTINLYIDALNECSTLEDINSIKQKYNKLIELELQKEKMRKKELMDLKESLKKAEIYNFYQISKTLNISDIINANLLLINKLELISLLDFNNQDFLYKLINDLNYYNIEESFHKINLYTRSNNLENLNYSNEIVHLNDNNIPRQYIDMILDKYYLYATKKKETIEKIIDNRSNFLEIFKLLNNMNVLELDKIMPFLNNVSYKNLKLLIEAIFDFKDANNIYINRKDGEICVFKQTPKKIYTIYLNGNIENDISSLNDRIWKYIPLLKFFNLAKYSDGYEINRIGVTEEVLNDYNINYLYYTNDLLLCLVDDGENKCFKFLTNILDSKFIKSENTQITRNDYFDYYKNKNKCLKDFMDYISKDKSSDISKKEIIKK